MCAIFTFNSTCKVGDFSDLSVYAVMRIVYEKVAFLHADDNLDRIV